MEGETGAKGVLPRQVLCVAGVVLAVVGAFFVSVALGAVGIFRGVASFTLGARRLGRAAVILGVISVFVGLLVGQGVMAGAYDRAVDGWFWGDPAEQITEDG